MPCLNQDILFAVGKQLIEDGDQEEVMKFGLSGREAFESLGKVFASVTTLQLYKTHFFIGWGKKLCKFNFDKPCSKFLLQQIGNKIEDLHIGYTMTLYQPILDRIKSKQKLISFSTSSYCSRTFLDEFLPTFSSTLKYVTIPSYKMSATFRDTFNLKKLTISGPIGDDLVLYCCKTTTLELQFDYGTDLPSFSFRDYGNVRRLPSFSFKNVLPNSSEISPNIQNVEEIIVHTEDIYWRDQEINEFLKITEYFPGLQSFKHKYPLKNPQWIRTILLHQV